ncbi:MAG: 50S ribosomal protein L9 [Alphaproteobacteria bacterium]
MEIILLEKIEKLGSLGDVVKVKTGYARNYLLPQKKALRSSKENIAYFEAQRKHFEALNEGKKTEAEKLAQSLKGLEVVVVRQASETGQLYGSVTIRDIGDALKEKGLKVERKQILLDQPLKVLGLYDVKVSPHSEVSEVIKVNIARSQEDAARQVEEAVKKSGEIFEKPLVVEAASVETAAKE